MLTCAAAGAGSSKVRRPRVSIAPGGAQITSQYFAHDVSRVGHSPGCQLFEMTGALMRLDVTTGVIERAAPVAYGSPDERWAAGRAGAAISVHALGELTAPCVISVTAASPELITVTVRLSER